MKYDLLDNFKGYLYENLTENTARKYYTSVVKLFKDVQFNNFSELDTDFIISEANKFKTKNEFSAVKNGLKRLKDLYPELNLPDEEIFKNTSIHKRNWSKKPKKNIYLDTTNRKINQIQNPKLKYAYRLAKISGLRVSELAAVEKGDISFSEDGRILVEVRHGKGGSNGVVQCLKDNYLVERLHEYLEDKQDNEKIFYSSDYMRKRALELGLECHDLRRICAIEYRNQLKKIMPVYEANQEVKKMLRHKRFSTTKRYLFNRKLVIRGSKNVPEGVGQAT